MGALRYQQRQFFMSYANHWKIDVDAERLSVCQIGASSPK